jgi:hypothetical protein
MDLIKIETKQDQDGYRSEIYKHSKTSRQVEVWKYKNEWWWRELTWTFFELGAVPHAYHYKNMTKTELLEKLNFILKGFKRGKDNGTCKDVC